MSFLDLSRVPEAGGAHEPALVHRDHIVAILPNPEFHDANSEMVLSTGLHLMVHETLTEIRALLAKERAE